jgi:hypothetical protein
MGTWGIALYSGDFAADLRATIAAVLRLPFKADRLADIICDTEQAAAKNPDDSDYTTFWLVVADQFAKRGLRSDRVRGTALQIIDEGRDLDALRTLGMPATDLGKRARVLGELRARIVAPTSEKPRDVIRKPQPFLMAVGDVLIYPTEGGKPFNPYLSPRRVQSIVAKHGRAITFAPDGWSACVIVARGKAFEFLAWYQALTPFYALQTTPSLTILTSHGPWRLTMPGTCSKAHFERMQLKKIADVTLDFEALTGALGPLRDGTRAAVSDISIANHLAVAPAGQTFKDYGAKVRRINSLAELISPRST